MVPRGLIVLGAIRRKGPTIFSAAQKRGARCAGVRQLIVFVIQTLKMLKETILWSA